MYGFGKDDLFSPLRTDASFTDKSCNLPRESESLPEFLPAQNALMLDKNMGEIMCQMKTDFFENATQTNKTNGTKEQLVFQPTKVCEDNQYKAIQNEFVPAANYEDIIFGSSYDKDFPVEVGTKRNRSSSQSKKDYPERNFNSKIASASFKSKQAKRIYNETLQNYIPLRSETRKSKEKFDKLNVKTTPFQSSNLLKCTEKKVVEVIDLETADSCDSNPERNFSGTNNADLTQLLRNGTECVNEKVNPPKRNTYDYSIDEVSICTSSHHFYNQAQQIQASITEQLIKETIAFEFEAIRQLLYLHHILLYRHLNKLEVFENQNSSNSEFILRVIEELMQENRLLKKAITPLHRKV